LIDYWSEGTNVYSQQLAPFFAGNGSGITNGNGAPMILSIFAGNTGGNAPAAATISYYALQGNSATNLVASDASAVTRTLFTRKTLVTNLWYLVSAAPGANHTNRATYYSNGVATALSILLTNTMAKSSNTTVGVLMLPGDEGGLQITNDASASAAKHSWSVEGQ
jgi:hypothetical protein